MCVCLPHGVQDCMREITLFARARSRACFCPCERRHLRQPSNGKRVTHRKGGRSITRRRRRRRRRQHRARRPLTSADKQLIGKVRRLASYRQAVVHLFSGCEQAHTIDGVISISMHGEWRFARSAHNRRVCRSLAVHALRRYRFAETRLAKAPPRPSLRRSRVAARSHARTHTRINGAHLSSSQSAATNKAALAG